MSDPEPRRSVRATKGQHKALEQLDQAPEAPKRRGKGQAKGKKAAAEPEPEDQPEVIRCVCGATTQEDEEEDEPWIACDKCGAWQHNVCMGISQYDEDIPKKYFCELCRPENHKETLAAIARGEKPWETRRKAWEEEKLKKKKGPKKGTKKRNSDPKDVKAETNKSAQQKSKSSPMPEPKPAKEAKEPKKDKEPKSGTVAGQKRKAPDGAPEKEPKARKVSDTQSVPVPSYTAPADLADKISDLPEFRQGPAKALFKSLSYSIAAAEKKGEFLPSDGVSASDRADRFALQIERAVSDSHPTQSSYASQVRTLSFNLKNNPKLCSRLLAGSLTPTMLAAMSTEELASEELQKETAEMKARAEKQAIKITEDIPRIRKTHKGDEIIGDEMAMAADNVPSAPVPRQPTQQPAPPKRAETKPSPVLPAPRDHSGSPHGLALDTRQSPTKTDFDFHKVLSSVKSPTKPVHPQRLPVVAAPVSGPGEDADVDRLLDDGTQSPPYSPKADELEPGQVWRGDLVMSSIGSVHVSAKHVGGARLDETINLPWDQLIPRTLSVMGRIEASQAIVYLCGLRYSKPTDVIVVNLEPTSETMRPTFNKIFDYFVSKKRYGVIGDRGTANVRDTYLVPVLPGTGNPPEFMMNLEDNFIPQTRTEPMLLAVFVYRVDPETMSRMHPVPATSTQPQFPPAGYSQSPGTPTPTQAGFPQHGRPSLSAPAFSPTSPQGAFPPYESPQNNGAYPPPPPPAGQFPTGFRKAADPRQEEAEMVARQVLGNLITSPTVNFLLPQAQRMSRQEWEVIKKLYERDPKTREDLPYLSSVLEKEGGSGQPNPEGQPAPAPATAVPPQMNPAPMGGVPGLGAIPPPMPASAPLVVPPGQAQAARRKSQPRVQPQPAYGAPLLPETPVPPPQHPVVRNTPIPPPPIPPHAAVPPATIPRKTPPRQTPIPPPPIPPQATATAGAPPTQ